MKPRFLPIFLKISIWGLALGLFEISKVLRMSLHHKQSDAWQSVKLIFNLTSLAESVFKDKHTTNINLICVESVQNQNQQTSTKIFFRTMKFRYMMPPGNFDWRRVFRTIALSVFWRTNYRSPGSAASRHCPSKRFPPIEENAFCPRCHFLLSEWPVFLPQEQTLLFYE